MIKEIKSLSNKIILDTNKNMIIKKYDNDEFQKKFGRQEEKILNKLDIKNKKITKDQISIEYFKHVKFNDNKMTKSDLKLVAQSLKNLHKINTKKIKIANFKKPYLKLLLKDINIDIDEKKIFCAAMSILKKGKQVILHNDVVEGNLLKVDNKIVLIDFEYSGKGNFIFDLASFITERDITETQIEYFINQYDKNINKKDLMIVCAFLQIFWHRWALYKQTISNKKIFKEIANWKLEKYNILLKDLKDKNIIS